MNKKIVYIAHPISGDIKENLKDIIRIIRIINTNSHCKNPKMLKKLEHCWSNDIYSEETLMQYLDLSSEDYQKFVNDEASFNKYDFENIVPSVPYYADVIALDDTKQDERSKGLANCYSLLKKGSFDELWLTGNRLSLGMIMEMEVAKELNMPIVDYIREF